MNFAWALNVKSKHTPRTHLALGRLGGKIWSATVSICKRTLGLIGHRGQRFEVGQYMITILIYCTYCISDSSKMTVGSRPVRPRPCSRRGSQSVELRGGSGTPGAQDARVAQDGSNAAQDALPKTAPRRLQDGLGGQRACEAKRPARLYVEACCSYLPPNITRAT